MLLITLTVALFQLDPETEAAKLNVAISHSYIAFLDSTVGSIFQIAYSLFTFNHKTLLT